MAALQLAPPTDDSRKLADAMNDSGLAVVGTPDMAVAQIERLVERSGGFGTYLLMAHEWADPVATLRSFELFARHVAPHFQGSAERAEASRDWAAARRGEFVGAAGAAVMKAVQDHHAERAARD